MSTDKFFRNRKIWSERKHRLLRNYLEPFTAKVAKTTRDRLVYIIDGFAGQAKYDDGSDGSPLLIARFSDVATGWQNPATIRLVNIEPDEVTFSMLDAATHEWKRKGVVSNIKGEFKNVLVDVVPKLGSSPALFFIDPFGPTYVHFDDLDQILERTEGLSELIINFDTDGLYRLACGALSANTEAKTAHKFAEHVSKIIGSDSWKESFEAASFSTAEGEDFLLKQYLQKLATSMTYVVSYPIRESLDSRPKYHFVFCTRHLDGLVLMNDFVRHEDDLIYGEHVEASSPLFVNLDLGSQAINRRRLDLQPLAIDYFTRHDPIIRKHMIEYFAINHFGEFDGKDLRAIFKAFIESGLLTTTDNSTGIDLRRFKYSAVT